ncbi:MAG: hypothetical protein WC091_02545 [Sulfuricellaceae bacterium]
MPITTQQRAAAFHTFCRAISFGSEIAPDMHMICLHSSVVATIRALLTEQGPEVQTPQEFQQGLSNFSKGVTFLSHREVSEYLEHYPQGIIVKDKA